jgi:hypothetical protein
MEKTQEIGEPLPVLSTGARAVDMHAAEMELTADVQLMVEALAAGLFRLREAQRAAAEAREAHLRALGLPVPPTDLNRGLGPFGLFSGRPQIVGALYGALLNGHTLKGNAPGYGVTCGLDDAFLRGCTTLLSLPRSIVETLPSCDARIVVEGEVRQLTCGEASDWSAPADFWSVPRRVIPQALFDRCVAAAREAPSIPPPTE